MAEEKSNLIKAIELARDKLEKEKIIEKFTRNKDQVIAV
jgi:hypothetical protein